MNVYDIKMVSFSERVTVVADSMAEAEKIFKAKYIWHHIESITTHAESVLLQAEGRTP